MMPTLQRYKVHSEKKKERDNAVSFRACSFHTELMPGMIPAGNGVQIYAVFHHLE